MNASPPQKNAWTLRGTLAELRHGKLTARVDIARPERGVHSLQLDGRDLAGHIVAVQRDDASSATSSAWPLALADAYIRGDDLVATYAPTDDWPFAPQLYWRATTLDSIGELVAAIALLVSVQTDLLDTWPRITVSSQLDCQELLAVEVADSAANPLRANESIRPAESSSGVLHRLSDLSLSYAEVMPASDFHELRVRQSTEGSCRAEWHLFADFLEKGVIRRARLQTAFLPRQRDVPLAVACGSALDRRPLPLTT